MRTAMVLTERVLVDGAQAGRDAKVREAEGGRSKAEGLDLWTVDKNDYSQTRCCKTRTRPSRGPRQDQSHALPTSREDAEDIV